MYDGAFCVNPRAESTGVRGYAEGVVIMLAVVRAWTLLSSSGGCFVEKMDLICYAASKCQWVQVHEYVQKNSLTQICSLQKDGYRRRSYCGYQVLKHSPDKCKFCHIIGQFAGRVDTGRSMYRYTLQEFAYTKIVAIKMHRVDGNNAPSNCEDYNAFKISRCTLLRKKDRREHVQLDRKRRGNNEQQRAIVAKKTFAETLIAFHSLFRGPFLRLEL